MANAILNSNFCFLNPSLKDVDRKWGGRLATPALTVSKCKKFDLFFLNLNLILGYSEHILHHCEGSQKYIFDALFLVAYDHPNGLADCK